MDQKNCLGFYIRPHWATVVVLVNSERGPQFVDSFQVKPLCEQDQPPQTMGQALIAACLEKQIVLSDPFITLDCGKYNQHNVHSQFTDLRKISQTIRFDAEEAIATDASEAAITFNVVGQDETGSTISVYSSGRKTLADLLVDLQQNSLDPVAIEPDVAALARFIRTTRLGSEAPVLYVVIAGDSGYLFTVSGKTGFQSRTFIINKNANVTDLLAREILLTQAAIIGGDDLQRIELFDGPNQVNSEKLAARAGLEVRRFELLGTLQTSCADPVEPVDFAIAYGSALAALDKMAVDFRRDFAPYQGRKMMMEKALKIMSISLTVMMLAAGLFLQMRTYVSNCYDKQLLDGYEQQYKKVVPGSKFINQEAINKLKREMFTIKQVKEGQLNASGQASVSVLLTNLLQTINEAGNVTLTIDSITVQAKSIVITGETPSRENTLQLIAAIDKHPALRLSQPNYDLKAGKDSFSFTILPKIARR